MYDFYENWKKRAKTVGLDMSKLCRLANADRKTIERLKEHIPKALRNYLTIEQLLTELEKKKNETTV